MRDAEPKPDLIVHSAHPLNAEPPLDKLRASFITAASNHYLRSHGDIPTIDARTHRVQVTGKVTQPLDLSLADLKARFPQKSVTAVLQCAGNRRADLQGVEPTTGDPWGSGAIGNAKWTGVALADVLHAAGVAASEDGHVAFESLDTAENENADDALYGVSIPLAKAMGGDVLLAWAMNDAPLTAEHGAPVRVVVPGYAGVRSAKWVAALRVQDEPSEAYQQRMDYLLYPPDVRPDTRDQAQGVTINEMPLNSAICDPQPGARLPAGDTLVRGYAVASDRAITRVDVSSDGGTHWRQATIEDHGNTRWSWVFWHIALPLAAGDHELTVRAWDAAGQTQPATPDDTWNFKGYLSAAWHRVPVTAVDAKGR